MIFIIKFYYVINLLGIPHFHTIFRNKKIDLFKIITIIILLVLLLITTIRTNQNKKFNDDILKQSHTIIIKYLTIITLLVIKFI